MKLAICIIALIGLTVSQGSTAVSPTTSLAETYQAAAQKAAKDAATALDGAAATLKSAKEAREAAEVPTAKWTAFKDAMTLVNTTLVSLVGADTTLAGLVGDVVTAQDAATKAVVDNQCQVMGAAMRVTWNNLAKSMVTTSATPYGVAETAFTGGVPKAADFTDKGEALKKSFTDLNTFLTDNKEASKVPAGVKDPSSANPKDYKAWDPTGAQAESYQKIGCPWSGSSICLDCDGSADYGPGPTPFKKDTELVKEKCTWTKLNAWGMQLSQTYTQMVNVNTAKGAWTAYNTVQTDYIAKADTGITATNTAYQGVLNGYQAKVTAYMAQVDKLAALLLQMQQASTLAGANAALMKTGSAAVMAATKVISDAAASDSSTATGKVAGLRTAANDAAKAVANQWTVCNTTQGDAMKAMGAARVAVSELATANTALMGALKAQGIAHELYTSSQASDAASLALQQSYAAQTKLSLDDYNNVKAMQAASGSSMIKQTISLFSIFAIILAYRKF